MKFLPPIQKNFTDVCGIPEDGGRVFVYLCGTTDLATLYGDSEGLSFAENPYRLDSVGSLKFFVDADIELDYVIKDSDGHVAKSFNGIKVNSCDGQGGGPSGDVEWDNVKNKPETFPPSQHRHNASDVDDLPSVPTKTSQLKNDSGFIAEVVHDDTMTGEGSLESPVSVNEMVGAKKLSIDFVHVGDNDYPCRKIGTQIWTTKNIAEYIPGNWRNTKSGDDVYYAGNISDHGSGFEDLIPEGWRVPTQADYDALVDFVGGKDVAGTNLKSVDGWKTNSGLDTVGFTALPRGIMMMGSVYSEGELARFVTSTPQSSDYMMLDMRYYMNDVSYTQAGSTVLGSLRLVKDAEEGGDGIDGKRGLVPTPTKDDVDRVLSGAGTFVDLPRKTSQLENDSDFVMSKVINNIVKVTELPETPDANTLYLVVEEGG